MSTPAVLGAKPLLDIEETILGMIARDAIKVPPYPAVVVKLREVTARESYGLNDVLAITSSDQVLAGDVLRCANSALYGSSGSVTSLQQAVNRVGAKEVVRLAMASSLAASVRTPSSLQSLKRKVWQGSLASALVTEVIGKRRRLPAEDAFLCGLLHDFGWVVGIAAIEEILVANPDFGARPETYWSGMLDRWHVRLGLALAARWKLPELYRDVIWHHHEAHGASQHAEMIAAVRTSDEVVALLGAHASVGEAELAQIVGLSPQERAALVEALPALPTVIAAFEQAAAPAHVASMVEQPETTMPAGFRLLQGTVNQVNPGKRGPFGMIGISLNGWVMRGREALPENQLMEAQVLVEPPLRLWAKTTLCKADADGYLIECKPFALNGPTKAVWQALFRKAEASG